MDTDKVFFKFNYFGNCFLLKNLLCWVKFLSFIIRQFGTKIPIFSHKKEWSLLARVLLIRHNISQVVILSGEPFFPKISLGKVNFFGSYFCDNVTRKSVKFLHRIRDVPPLFPKSVEIVSTRWHNMTKLRTQRTVAPQSCAAEAISQQCNHFRPTPFPPPLILNYL